MSKALLASALLLVASATQAQSFYKCTQPGGGTAYQSTPCAVAGAKPASHPSAAQLNAQRASAPPVVARNAGDAYSDDRRRRDCTVALQNQMVLKRVAENPNSTAYSTDKNGQRTYVDPSPELMARNERQAAAKCD